MTFLNGEQKFNCYGYQSQSAMTEATSISRNTMTINYLFMTLFSLRKIFKIIKHK